MNKKVINFVRKSRVLSGLCAAGVYVTLPLTHGQKKLYDKAIKTFSGNIDLKITPKIKFDILYSRIYYLTTYSQYFIFEFYNKSRKARKEYVGEYEKKLLTYKLHNSSDAWKYFKDKYSAYQKFGEYYKREIIKIESEKDRKVYDEFCKKHSVFMLKAIDKAEGEDIFKVDLNKENADAVFKKALSLVPCVLEQYIVQSAEMARFHPASVNTIRYATYRRDDGLIKLWALIRIGCGGKNVDNAGSGGICGSIDIDTGVIKTLGYREDGTSYVCHPDTGVPIIGSVIPRWDECNALVEKLAYVVPEQRYVGWDLALTDDGWCMIEGNDRAMFTASQMCERHGAREIIEKAFKSR